MRVRRDVRVHDREGEGADPRALDAHEPPDHGHHEQVDGLRQIDVPGRVAEHARELKIQVAARHPHRLGDLRHAERFGGVLANAKGGANLQTDGSYGDFKLHVEFRFPAGGNSGVYLRGRYEVQIEDPSLGVVATEGLGAIYGFIAPNEQAAKAAGEWNSYDITLVGRLLTVVLNGREVIARQNIPGPTGGALDSNEGAPGPIFLQGDHGPIEYRNITIAVGH